MSGVGEAMAEARGLSGHGLARGAAGASGAAGATAGLDLRGTAVAPWRAGRAGRALQRCWASESSARLV